MFKIKYFHRFKSVAGNSYKIEVLEKAETEIEPREVANTDGGFLLQYNDLEEKSAPVWGAGADFAFLAPSKFEFIDLYTADIQQFQIRFYANGVLIWAGWLNTEFYEETLNGDINSPVQFTAADFNVLERLKYLNPAGEKYEGIKSFFEVLKDVLTALGLPFNRLLTASSTTTTETTISASETILHGLSIKAANFYDEDGEAMTAREVLDCILGVLGLTLKQVNNDFVIYDLNSLVNGSTFKAYSGANYDYLGAVYYPIGLGDLGVKEADANPTYSLINSFNRLRLTYSSYKDNELAVCDVDLKSATTLKTSTEIEDKRTVNGTAVDYSYKIEYYDDVKELQLQSRTLYDNRPVFYIPTGANIQNKDVLAGIKLKPYQNDARRVLRFSKRLPVFINESERYALKISAKILISTKKNVFVDNSKVTNKLQVTQCLIPFKLFFIEKSEPDGSYTRRYFNAYDNRALLDGAGGATWVKSNTIYDDEDPAAVSKMQFCEWGLGATIADKWTTCKSILYAKDYTGERITPTVQDYYIPLPAGSYGELVFQINEGYSILNAFGAGVITAVTPDFVLLDGLQLSIVDGATGETIELTDYEYNSHIDKRYKNEAPEQKLTAGVNLSKYPIENGSILIYDKTAARYKSANQFARNGAADIIERLNIRSYISNHSGRTSQLRLTLDNDFNQLGLYTFRKYFGGTTFLVCGANIDFANETTETTLKEVCADHVNINEIDFFE